MQMKNNNKQKENIAHKISSRPVKLICYIPICIKNQKVLHRK